ncbi:MAG TPA: class II glutamine amidotransferase [Kofleriaceae bacterium]|jgi:glutamine amidotransferase|nr:class II glutamine amidotransferase [Kofleriaceae bacterium]
MFGLAAARPVALRDLLCEAPRSLRTLSHEHRDGWGVAIRIGDGWRVERDTQAAAMCARYLELASIDATLAIAHVRNKTVGDISLANTHPFCRRGFVFAHNGTVRDLTAISARSAPEHLAAIEGDTDSERLFAFVLTHIDEAGDIPRGVTAAVRALHAISDVGSVNFLLSCGARLYAHRLGRSLYTLRRDDVSIVASEPLTDESWLELGERQLVILEGAEQPRDVRSAA